MLQKQINTATCLSCRLLPVTLGIVLLGGLVGCFSGSVTADPIQTLAHNETINSYAFIQELSLELEGHNIAGASPSVAQQDEPDLFGSGSGKRIPPQFNRIAPEGESYRASGVMSMLAGYGAEQTGVFNTPHSQGELVDIWSPITSGESPPANEATPILDASSEAGDDAKLHFDIDVWLPQSERHIMYSYARRLTDEHRLLTGAMLAKAGEHVPMIVACLEEHGVPRELAALPFIESSFRHDAVSHSGAVGLWQLLPETARRFGLIVNEDYDERLDILKSTAAAARYLKYLYQRFSDWPLVLAAYNGGEGTLNSALRKSGAATLHDLAYFCRYRRNLLPEETLQFVPRFVAAAIVMSNSKELGLSRENLIELGEKSSADNAVSAMDLPQVRAVESSTTTLAPRNGETGKDALVSLPVGI